MNDLFNGSALLKKLDIYPIGLDYILISSSNYSKLSLLLSSYMNYSLFSNSDNIELYWSDLPIITFYFSYCLFYSAFNYNPYIYGLISSKKKFLFFRIYSFS